MSFNILTPCEEPSFFIAIRIGRIGERAAQHPVRGSGAKPKRGACYTGLRQRSPVVQLADTIRAAREKDFITLARDRAPYADFMQDRAALSAPAERSPSRKFRRNLDGVIEHVPFGPRTYIFFAVVAAAADAFLADTVERRERIFRRDMHR